MALTTAVGLGAIAAVVIPWMSERTGVDVAGLLSGEYVRIPIGGGIELHWSWLIFCIVTLIAWASFKLTETR
ncbi:hypothetical protein HZF05_04450 [Sphingomonas sp. CGMCC 1.13654]|uniref:Uncharacterized protein n=1 Tax=Sphingomonas chungangi TaxID=2683589 RepID=A0A838L337_9SPHN|nr:hypothetical protein [Sphingomonas chungangi]MBA2933340.1 hypothetical protein [Sphingomonas chungangi]MVW54674.1 hypothetical protein [Sphingomonas chungangi]